MQKLSLTFRGKTFREFTSTRQMIVYFLDLLIKLTIITFFCVMGIEYTLIDAESPELVRFVFIYLVAILVWGLILIKSLVQGRKVFGKTQLDIYFMGILTFSLISVLLSEYRTEGVFGSFGTWSYSIITLLSISIIYYVTVLLFKYLRGLKWLSVTFLLSILLPAVYYVVSIIRDEETSNLDFLRYAVLGIPMTIGVLFVFRKIWLKIITFIALLLNLFLIAYYSNFLTGAMFVLSIGVLTLFVLFYFSFWIKNGNTIISFARALLGKLFNFSNLKNLVKERKRESLIFLMVILMALWILGFTSFSLRYFNQDIGPYIADWFREDFEKFEGVRMWIIGKNDLSTEFSSFESMNILANYGLVTFLIFLSFMIYGIYLSGKMTLKLLYKGSFRNIVLLSSIFVTIVTILTSFLVARMTPMVYMLLLFVSSMVAVIYDLLNGGETYSLEVFEDKLSGKEKIIKIVLSIVIFGTVILGFVGILTGLDKGIF
ncbi:hypothetical protein JW766_00445 [Candidatus Dojkabacteria bacterium]|nr:hypothetical protein [Candidatus Dojkabacteria bacterium]